MKYVEIRNKSNEEFLERYELVMERIKEIATAPEIDGRFVEYFKEIASFLSLLDEIATKALNNELSKLSNEDAQNLNKRLFQAESKENYGTSYLNPTVAVKAFGKELGQILACVYRSCKGMVISQAYEGKIARICLWAELVMEIYVALNDEDTTDATIKDIYYSFCHDAQEVFIEDQLNYRLNPDYDASLDIVMNSDLSNPLYLYGYGLNITENEVGICEFLNTLSEEEIQSMADTYTEGYRIGFKACNKDITKKAIAELRYPVGFERMVKAAVKNFEKMGLRSVCFPYSTPANKQFDFDFREMNALVFDKAYVERNLEVVRMSFEHLKEVAPLMGGPAVIEVFGEEPFSPEFKEDAPSLDEKQQQLDVYFKNEYMQIYSKGIAMENRSFTIIAYPVPTIGDKFKEIFAETVKINTLDYFLYQGIQQKIIDVLDTADYVHVLGTNGNKTDIKVKIWPLEDRAKETAFENCVADVNIPVGEVFTSPVLEGTNGKLHVSQVYLNELNYLNLELDFVDGKISQYTCSNFEKEEENKKYILDNLMYHHETLPIGEFAIGTNTSAFVMARKYDIADKMPILIAEKTGPHFAVGDTCYTYDEDNVTYNPDGKKIVARDNSVSRLRKTDISKAYLNCHTDITIPYDELGKITAVAADGSSIDIIVNGRFVLPGTEELNKALDEYNK